MADGERATTHSRGQPSAKQARPAATLLVPATRQLAHPFLLDQCVHRLPCCELVLLHRGSPW